MIRASLLMEAILYDSMMLASARLSSMIITRMHLSSIVDMRIRQPFTLPMTGMFSHS